MSRSLIDFVGYARERLSGITTDQVLGRCGHCWNRTLSASEVFQVYTRLMNCRVSACNGDCLQCMPDKGCVDIGGL